MAITSADRYLNVKPNGHRKQLAEFLRKPRFSRIHASYDAAGSSDEFKNYWANADTYDADSANSRAVREKLVSRSRYEIQNNPYADGIASTWTTDLIGKGPALRMQTGSQGFNQMVEAQWYLWQKAIGWRRKLWCLAHATHSDGEGIGIIRRNPDINHPIKLDVKLIETEQCQTPMLGYGEKNYIDGIKFSDAGNPVFYDILKEHPGSSTSYSLTLTPEKVPARFVLHWFKMRRPGQHRGIPHTASSLNTGAAARRLREATLAAAETAADFAVLLETMYEPDELDIAEPFSTLDIQKRMMTALPNNAKVTQLRAEHPNSTYSEFHKTLINEQARPVSMPFNKAACDSSDYNFASGRLDHITFYGGLDVDRDDCDDLVMDPLFDVWFDHAILNFGWLGGNPDVITPAAKLHTWDWPKHRVADEKTAAAATDTQLKNATKSLAASYTDAGLDYEDAVTNQAASNGVTVDQQKQINMLVNLPQHAVQYVASMIGITTPEPEPQPTDKGQDNGEEKNESGDEE